MQLSFHFVADSCYHYINLSEANRKISCITHYDSKLCDRQLPEGWYRFVGAAGRKLPTTRAVAYRCGTDWSGWLDGAHPTEEDDEVRRTVRFSIVHLRLRFTNTQQRFLFKTVDPTSSTNFIIRQVVFHTTVVKTEYEVNLRCAARGLIVITRSVGTCVEGF